MQIIPLEEVDKLQFHKLMQTVLSETNYLLMDPDNINFSISEFATRLNNLLANDSCCLVAKDGDELVGYVMAIRVDKLRRLHVANIVLALKKSHWCQGIGKSLLHAIELWCAQNNISRMELLVREDNIAAIKLYQKMGYVAEGRKQLSFAVHQLLFDELLFAKLLCAK
jgi:ribosomal protein S18 acetylase RimI-like enzyme